MADDYYVVESILNPQARVVEGWGNAEGKSIMPPYQGAVSAEDLNALVAYIRYLKTGKIIPPNAKDAAPVGAPGEAPPKTPSGSEK